MNLTVLSYNTLFAGHDGSDDRRSKLQIELINHVKPDIFLMQEVKELDRNGFSEFFALESQIGMRGFLAIAPRTRQHTAVFIRAPLEPVSFEADGDNFHHALAKLVIKLPNGKELTALSAHLCPYGPAVREREACYLTAYPAPGALTLLAGDFNSISKHDPDPADLAELALRDRSRYVADYMRTPDHSVSTRLEHAGWVDIGHKLGGNDMPTVPASGFKNTEFATMRCDYIMASDSLAFHASTYHVLRDERTSFASDHYPIMATFELED
jgi:endonuclease/exonuclease/phosphatase family metal-dependent hydrolase